MSLEQAYAFYEVLMSDKTIYEQYLINCRRRGLLGSYHWDKTKIVNFASSLGYKFSEYELTQVWFESQPIVSHRLSVVSH
ncbi:hypothetical protein [Nostoc sp. TCL26-01]|uniref:hypothetical protein n=1 Tax=Nostoc sp. TCL26-01 TaxID=2576904 RepID=UPI0015BEF900|nr:hypothetical protein [Nostoc sp. TCL26-01]QLE56984.1 hypothetical protein FD725_16550 [Nostoc sp. TCL26-01]